MQIQELTSYLAADAPPRRSASPAASIWMEPPYGIYACATGHLAIAQAELKALGETIDCPELGELKGVRPAQADADALAAWRDRIYDIIAARLMTRDAAHWDQLLTERGLWCGLVNDYASFLAHPQTSRYLTAIQHPLGGEYETVAPAIWFSDDPEPALRAAPLYGADTGAVLAEAGFSDGEIATLLQDGTAVAR
jgi:crotonobetainyl-CoA:carnitine CoA-transferase CaiB-like acyl-CoA transferase